jgi:NADH-quinone oxidoreductase subunit A
MPDNYFVRYLPFLIHILLAGGIAIAIVTLSWVIGERKPTRAKLAPYECGMTPIYPWAVILRDLKRFGLWEMLVYIGIFLVGFFYVWKKGVLDWGAASFKRGEL